MSDGSRLHRRRFLSSSLLAALAPLPFVRLLDGLSFGPGEARAAGNAKFLVTMYHPFGVHRPEWNPDAFGRSFALKRASAGLAPIKDDVILVSNLDNAIGEKLECALGADQHNAAVSSIWTGVNLGASYGGNGSFRNPGGPSIDSIVAKHLAPGKHHDDVVLNLGVRSDEHFERGIRQIHQKMDGTIVTSRDDPRAAFQALFGEGGTAGKPAAPDERPFLTLRDALREDLGLFERALAGPERERFQSHMSAFADFDKSLDDAIAPQNVCARLPSAQEFDPNAVGKVGIRDANIWVVAELQVKLIALALSCGARRVATLHLTDGFRDYRVPAGPFPDTGNFNGHDLSHHAIAGNAVNLRTNLNFRQAQLFTMLVQELKSKANPLGPGSLFDDAIVAWSSCISGAGPGGHSKMKVPLTLAAGKNAGFKTGRHIDVKYRTTNSAMLSVCQAFGMPLEVFGDREFCPGPLPGLTDETNVAPESVRLAAKYFDSTDRCRTHDR